MKHLKNIQKLKNPEIKFKIGVLLMILIGIVLVYGFYKVTTYQEYQKGIIIQSQLFEAQNSAYVKLIEDGRFPIGYVRYIPKYLGSVGDTVVVKVYGFMN